MRTWLLAVPSSSGSTSRARMRTSRRAASRHRARCGVRARLAPMLLGGVFRAIGAGDGPMATLSPAKAAHNLARHAPLGRARSACRSGCPRRTRCGRFARCACCSVCRTPAGRAAIARDLRRVLAARRGRHARRGDRRRAARRRASPTTTIADALAARRHRRDQGRAARAHRRGGRARHLRRAGDGSCPATGREPILLWGQDRLAVGRGDRSRLGSRRRAAAGRAAPARARRRRAARRDRSTVYFDVASPFAYLGSTQLARARARRGVDAAAACRSCSARCSATSARPTCRCSRSRRRSSATSGSRWRAGRAGGACRSRSRAKFPQRTVTAQRLRSCSRRRSARRGLAARARARPRDVGRAARPRG